MTDPEILPSRNCPFCDLPARHMGTGSARGMGGVDLLPHVFNPRLEMWICLRCGHMMQFATEKSLERAKKWLERNRP